ncbi:hypothetical protein ABKN59_003411 [Abortiporus biennis]
MKHVVIYPTHYYRFINNGVVDITTRHNLPPYLPLRIFILKSKRGVSFQRVRRDQVDSRCIMRSVIIVGLVTILSFISSVVAVPHPSHVARAPKGHPSQALQARSPKPSHVFEKRSSNVTRAPHGHPSQVLQARSPKPSHGFEKRSSNVARAPHGHPSQALAARSPKPSHGYEKRDTSPVLEARSPEPSHHPPGKRAETPLEKRHQETLSQEEMSSLLCPLGDVCPIQGYTTLGNVKTMTPRTVLEWIRDGFECVDFEYDLTSCGGCGSLDVRHDCTAIPGSQGVSCHRGSCKVHTCEAGFTRSPDGKSCARVEVD